MLSIRKINPMVRAIGTMGAITALVGAVTFAQFQSNTVALTDNSVSTNTAALKIQDGTTCSNPGTSDTGMTVTNLNPGSSSDPFAFCLDNTGTTSLALSTGIPTSFNGSTVPPSAVTLNIDCGVGGTFSGTLSSLNVTQALTDSNLPTGITDCTASVTLSPSYNGSGGSVVPFELDFSGTQIEG